MILPAREVAGTIGPIIDAIAPLERLGLVDELLVVDAASRDGTADVARAHGARVVQESAVLPDAGPCRGKGDAMWRGLAATEGDVVAYVDADTADFDASFVTGLLGPLVTDPAVALVKGAFRRPLRAGQAVLPDEGGRVTELVARPLLAILAPELGGLLQPLAGEQAARRDLLEAIPFPVGYGIETSMLLDALALRGLDAIAQVDLGTRQNRHQPLRELGRDGDGGHGRRAAAGAARGGVGGLRRRTDALTRARRRDGGPRRAARRAPSARRAAPPGGSGRLLGVTALGELLDHLRAERRQVVRLAARHQPAVDVDLLVHPVRAGVLRSVRSVGHDVMVRPSTTPASMSVHGPWQITATGFPSSKKPRTKRWTSPSVRR